jgi:hypothetical protein
MRRTPLEPGVVLKVIALPLLSMAIAPLAVTVRPRTKVPSLLIAPP